MHDGRGCSKHPPLPPTIDGMTTPWEVKDEQHSQWVWLNTCASGFIWPLGPKSAQLWQKWRHLAEKAKRDEKSFFFPSQILTVFRLTLMKPLIEVSI